jgi:hypothetical protein
MFSRHARVASALVLLAIASGFAAGTSFAETSEDGDKAAAHKSQPELAARADALIAKLDALAVDLKARRDAGCAMCNNLRGIAEKMSSRTGTWYTAIDRPNADGLRLDYERNEVELKARTFTGMLKASRQSDESVIAAAWQSAVDDALALIDEIATHRTVKK